MVGCNPIEWVSDLLRRHRFPSRSGSTQAMSAGPSQTTAGSASPGAGLVLTHHKINLSLKRKKKKKNDTDCKHIRMMQNVPTYTSTKALADFMSGLAFLHRVSCGQHDTRGGEYHIYLEFDKESSFENLLPQTPVTIDDQQFTLLELHPQSTHITNGLSMAAQMFTRGAPESTDVASKYAEFVFVQDSVPLPSCKYCDETIVNDLQTPCLSCQNVICHDCLQRNFEVGLRDHEAMPVSCCGKAIHPDTATGLLTDDQRAKYKMRFEEMCAKKPFYCAAPLCSTFISPRKLRVNDGMVSCHVCQCKTCYNCRQKATTGHSCSIVKAEEDKMLKQFGYKRCPTCGTGQARMFGCSHMRCPCGAHWCWECDKVTRLCICSQENQFDIDYDGESDDSIWEGSDDETIETPISSVLPADTAIGGQNDKNSDDTKITGTMATLRIADNNFIATEPVLVTASEPQNENDADNQVQTTDVAINDAVQKPANDNPASDNLDEYDSALEYDNELDFGDDPSDRMNDPWNCSHTCTDINRDKIPKYWMTTVDPQWRHVNADGKWERRIDCMLCQRSAKITLPGVAVENEKETAHRCFTCGIVYCGRCKARIHRRREKKRLQTENSNNPIP